MSAQHADGAVSSAAETDRSPSGARGEIVFTAAIGIGILAALTVLAVFHAAAHELTALGVGLLIALALDPVLRATQRRVHCSRAVGTLIVGGVLAVVIGGVVLFLGPQAADQAGKFAEELPSTVKDFYSWPVIGQRLEDADAVGRIEDFVADLPQKIDADSISGVMSTVLGGLGTALLVLVTATAVLLDGEAIIARIRRTIPAERQERADELGRVIYQSVARYFAGSVGVALLNGTMILTVGLMLGIPLAPLAAVWAAITNLIPQIGGFLGGSFFVVLAVTEGPIQGLIALVVFLAYQQLENHVIIPTVIGRAVKLTPPTTMLAALIGGAAAGVPGAIVAQPLLGAAKSIWLDTRAGGDDDDDDQGDDKPGVFRRIVDKVKGLTNR